MDLNLINTSLVTIEEIELIQELDKYKFSNKVYKMYKNKVKDNLKTSYQEAKKKIIRNIVLGDKEYNNCILIYKYGNLTIQINMKDKRIIYIKNSCQKSDWKDNVEKKDILNKIMNIEN